MRVHLVVVAAALALVAAVPALPAAADPANASTVTTATVDGVRATPGRVWWAEGAIVHVKDMDTSTTPATVSGSYPTRQVGTVVVGTTTTPVFSPAADRLAFLDPASPVVHVVDSTSGSPVADVPAITGLTGIKLSGAALEQDSATQVVVRDLDTGRQWTFPPSATLSGRYVAFFNANGSITRQDLVSGATLAVRGSEQPSVCTKATVACTPANSPVAVKLRGDWVFWKYSCELKGKNLATGVAAIDLSSRPTCLKKFTLLDGWLAFKDTTGLHARDLANASTPQADLVNGTVNGYAVENRSLAWSDAGGLHVGTLPLPSYSPATRLTDAATPPAFSPNGDGRLDSWLPSWSLSGPATWSLAVTGPNGPVPGSPFTGGAPSAAIRATWAPGADVPDGAYAWALSGTAPDGTSLKGTDGQGAGLSGTVVVRRTGLAGGVSAPLVAASLALPVQLSAASVPGLPGYGAVGYLVRLDDNGAVRTLSTTSATPAIAGVQGHTYRVSVQVVDSAGNTGPLSAAATTVVPLDDRSGALSYAGTWTRTASPGSFLSTVRSTRVRGAAVTIRTALSRFAVVVTRCPSCGQLRVYVDGRYVTTVDTRSSARTVRQTVLLRTVASHAATHTVRLVAMGTPGRPTVVLDAFAGIR